MESVEMLSEVVLVGRAILTNCKDMKTTCLRGNSTPSILLPLHGLLPFLFDSLAHCFLFSFSFFAPLLVSSSYSSSHYHHIG